MSTEHKQTSVGSLIGQFQINALFVSCTLNFQIDHKPGIAYEGLMHNAQGVLPNFQQGG